MPGGGTGDPPPGLWIEANAPDIRNKVHDSSLGRRSRYSDRQAGKTSFLLLFGRLVGCVVFDFQGLSIGQ